MKSLINFLVICLCATLTACSMGSMHQASNEQNGQEAPLGVNTKPGVAIGGNVSGSMDAFDRTKLNRALDKSPGTSTEWANENTGINYSVTPVKKVTVNGNSLCRQYRVTATKNGNARETNGTACVAADGAWSEV